MSTEHAIAVQGLCKSLDQHQVLRNLNLSVKSGTIVGLLGRNGAGKTTLLRTIMGALRADSGTAKVYGEDLHRAPIEVRSRVAYVPQEPALFGRPSLERYARLHTRFYPRFDIETARQLADRMAVDWKKSFGKLSQGNKRKAAVVLALASRADLLVMDEPAAGLDPIARRELYDVLIERMGSGGETTVLLSTHLVADLERLADRVAIIDGGRTLREGNVTAFTEELVRVQVIFPSDVPVGFAIPGARETTHEGAVALGIVDLAQAGDGLMELEHSSELRVTRFPLHLEDAFVELAGEPATSIQEISS